MEGRSGDPRGGGPPHAKGLRRRRGEEREKEGMVEDGEGGRRGGGGVFGEVALHILLRGWTTSTHQAVGRSHMT